MRTIRYLLAALFLGDLFSTEQYTVLKDFYNTHFFGRPLRTMIKPGDKVLELGCGKDSLINRARLIKKICVTGIDIFQPYVDFHNANGAYKKCIVGDITKMDFKTREFDAVVCMDVL